jgi:hypothetical protein
MGIKRGVTMKKFVLPFLLLFLLFGCQSQTVSNETLHDDAKNLYSLIKDSYVNNEGLDEYAQSTRDEFQETYIKNYKDYPNDEELVLNMEKLINSFTMYYVAIGLKKEDSVKMYKERIEDSISVLDKQFNK